MHSPIDDPQVLAFIARTEAAYPADANLATPQQNRRYYDAMCEIFRQPRPQSVHVRDSSCGAVPIRTYTPDNYDALRPEVLYLHGGGFVVGSLDSHDDVCAELADSTGLRVTAVDYRLAPEHKAPAQLDDVELVWRLLNAANPDIIVAGDSAGGTLAAGLCLRLRRLQNPLPMAQILIYPGLGGDLSLPSYRENAEAPLLRSTDIEAYRRLQDGAVTDKDQRHEYAPLGAPDLSALPPAYIFTADVDPLRDDGFEYHRRLGEAGGASILRNDAQLVHGYLRGRITSSRIASAFAAIVAAVKDAAGF